MWLVQFFCFLKKYIFIKKKSANQIKFIEQKRMMAEWLQPSSPSGQATPNGKEEIANEPIHSQKEANWAKLWEAEF